MKKAKPAKKKTDISLDTPNAPVMPVGISQTLQDNYMPYAMSVIISRAIPEIDGFKPSHRKLLYTMYKMGLMTGQRAKSADVVGQTMKLNPHGDASIYETMVRLTRGNNTLLHPWIDSKGNFGSVNSRDMQYAASRYTEVRLDPSCETLFTGLDSDAVDFVDNYSGTMKEPKLFPARFPTILVNNNQGIAVGMASNICSFNLREVCEATIALLKDEKADLLKYMPAPDFSTGAVILYDREQMQKIYESGKGSFRMRAVANINAGENTIDIKELPYTTTIEAVIEDIAERVKKGQLRDITNIRDETDLNGLCISITYKKSADPELLLQTLFAKTPLESNFSCNFNVLIDNKPKVLGVRELLQNWIAWRRECIRRESVFTLENRRERLHVLQGFQKLLLDIDLAIKVIRETEREKDVVPNLMAKFQIDEIQAEAICEIKLRQINKEFILKRLEAIKNLEAEISELEKLSTSQMLQEKRIISELKVISEKYGKDRKTVLLQASAADSISEADLIPDYNTKVFLTREGYFKKLAQTSLRGQFELKLKENDEIICEEESTNLSELIFLTNKGNCYKLFAHEVEDTKPSLLGEYLPNLLDLEADETVIHLHSDIVPFKGEYILAFANGKGVRFDASVYETIQKRKKLINAFSTESPIVSVYYLPVADADTDFVLVSQKGKVLIVKTSDFVKKKTRTAAGAQIMKLKNDTVQKFKLLKDVTGIEDAEYYRAHRLPASGHYLRENSLEARQRSIWDI